MHYLMLIASVNTFICGISLTGYVYLQKTKTTISNYKIFDKIIHFTVMYYLCSRSYSD